MTADISLSSQAAELAALRARVAELEQLLSDHEQRDLQQSSRAAANRYQFLIEHLPIAIYMANAKDINQTLYISPQIEPMLGYTPAEWCATPDFWLSRIHPDDRERMRLVQARFQETLDPVPTELRMLAKDGRVVWVHNESVVVRDDDGQPLFLLGFTQDITARKQAEAARDQLVAIVAASDDSIVATDLAGTVLSWNAGAERIYGYAAAEMVGRPMTAIVPPERLPEVSMIVERIRRGERIRQFETVRQRKDGTSVVVALSASPIYDDTGQIVSAAFVVRDITARKHAEEGQRFLSEAGALLAGSLDYEATLRQITRLVVPRLADGCSIYVADTDGQVRQVAAAHLTPEIEAIARELDRLYPADPNANGGLAEVLRTGQTLHIPNVSDERLSRAARDERHLALMRAQGLRAYILAPLLARGQVIGVIAFNAETPARRFDSDDLALAEELARRAALAIDNARLYRDAQRALRRQEEALARLDALLDNTPIGLGFMDTRLRYVRVNEALAALNRTPAAAHPGRTLREIIPQVADALDPLLRQVLTTGVPLVNYELNAVDPRSGQERSFLLNYYPVGSASQPALGIGMAIFEITALRQAEEAQRQLERRLLETQKLESLGVLAGGIAHDFNNLLVAILGNAELALLDLPQDSPAHASIAQVQVASRRAADLTGQMLAYSGRGRFVVGPVALNALIEELASLLHASIPKRVRLRIDLAPDLPAIEADATQVRQVLMNLVINAAEAIGEVEGVVTIATEPRHADEAYLATTYLAPSLPPGAYVAIEVADSGCGMDQATLERIFEPFFTTKFAGRGLGMAAVLGIVRGHKGTLKIASAPGQGTTVTVLLPAAGRPAAPGDPEAPRAAAPAAPPARRQVLIVDDEPSVRGVAARILERLGYAVLAAELGAEGLELYRAHAPAIDAVLLDLTMPQMSGEEVYQSLLRLDPDARVVIMSGYSAEDIRARFPSGARLGFLQKPFTPAALDRALREIGRA